MDELIYADPCSRVRCRIVYTAEGEFEVPRHIYRLESANTYGWQVRFTKRSKYFADGQHGGSADASLEAAKEHLRAVWRPIQWKTRRGVSRARGDLPAGVRVIEKREPRTTTVYVVATHPRYSERRFRVGPQGRFTESELQQVIEKATQCRASWLEQIPVPIR